jgi:hypothetical protein
LIISASLGLDLSEHRGVDVGHLVQQCLVVRAVPRLVGVELRNGT